jgi:GTP-binding protein
MKKLPVVAIIGRPNVGKSCLFNRLAKRFIAIVHDEPGVTRDVISAEIDKHFLLMDTSGIGLTTAQTPADIAKATEEQVHFAIQAADLILFIVNGQEGYTLLDERVASQLRNYGKPLVLVVNKIDTFKHQKLIDDFYRLGIHPVLGVSAEHNQGIEELLTFIETVIGPKPQEDYKPTVERIKICFAGRPNVGKSSIMNALLKSSRLIVSDTPGTTRDAIAIDFDYQPNVSAPKVNPESQPPAAPNKSYLFTLVDTAGVRTKSKIKNSVDFFSFLRTHKAIENVDIVFLVLDAKEGVTESDKKIAGKVLEAGKALVLVVNKWDYAKEALKTRQLEDFKSEREFRKAFVEAIWKQLFFLPKSPILFVSAQTNYAIESILEMAQAVHKKLNTLLSTGRVNSVIESILAANPPTIVHSKRFKVYYALQVDRNPFKIKLFCNRSVHLQDHYKRYLESRFNEAFDLKGCPIRFELIGKPPRVSPEV